MKNIIRVYADTSVFEGIIDLEFQKASNRFFEQIKDGQFTLVTSALVESEIRPAPREVVGFFKTMSDSAEIIHISDQAIDLRNMYLK